MSERGLRTPIPYLPIEKHGVIGDRRTGALVAADGTIDSLCLPDFGGGFLFGAVLDVEKGGFWRLGPARLLVGTQEYAANTFSLVTRWDLAEGALELTDLMPWPARERRPEQKDKRVVLRRLRCTRGQAPCSFALVPRWNFTEIASPVRQPRGAFFRVEEHSLWLWVSRPVEVDRVGVRDCFTLRAGEEVWAALVWGEDGGEWSVERARETLEQCERYWQEWAEGISYRGPRRDRVQRSALLVHLLGHAEEGAVAAALTTSLPERIGGSWNADYRLSWVRDASLSLRSLSLLGKVEDTQHYLEWLHSLQSSTDAPLQIAYGMHGQNHMDEHTIRELAGYRGSEPVRFGNHAYKQDQHDAPGHLLSCVSTYLDHGGKWTPELWDLIQRAADYLAKRWHDPGCSIWELSALEHFVSDRAMTWVGLDRAIGMAEQHGHAAEAQPWRTARTKVFDAVMQDGWSERLRSFKQSYECETVDSANLVIPLMGFLPMDHPRVQATVERIEEELTLDGLTYRFDPMRAVGVPFPCAPLGEFEGAFLPCTFWLASVYALRGQSERAEAILDRAEAVAGPLGIFAEAIDPRSSSFLGNYPLLFSQVTYLEVILRLARHPGV